MVEALFKVALFICQAVDFVLDIVATFSRINRLAKVVAGSDALVEVPADPKILPPAAQRALAEAEQRRRLAYAASGTVQAS
jgi:hypothetical protein